MNTINMTSGGVLGGAAFGAPVAEDAMWNPRPVRLAEPLVVATGPTDLTIWKLHPAGSVGVGMGSSERAAAETICIERDQLTAVWTTLKAIDEAVRS